MLVITVTCFGRQVAIFRLYRFEEIFSYKICGVMYLDAEISDHLDIALLLKMETDKRKFIVLGQCVSLGRVLTGEAL
jgi:predicted nucleotidyltransferase component of viral defense system